MEETKTFAVQEENEEADSQGEDELDRLLQNAIHKNDEGTLEEWQVLAHIFKGFVGAGILGLPSAVLHGGIVVGPIVLLFVGLLCTYNIKLLVDTARNVRETLVISRISYSGISEHLFNMHGKKAGYFAKLMTDFLLCTLQLGFCCVYIVFIANNLHVAVNKLDVRIWITIVTLLLLFPSLITNIGHLAYLTTIGNAIIFVGLGIIYQYLGTHIKDPSSLPAFNGFINVCVSFGQCVYAFEGIAIILPTEEKLKNRQSFPLLLTISTTLVLILYATMGILGYLAFGANTLGSITLNLPQTKLYQILQIFFAVMIYFTYPLQLLVSVEIIKHYSGSDERTPKQKHILEMLIRVILVLSTCILAICIPQLDNFMALVGSISGVAVGVILPPILHSICFWNQGLSLRYHVINILIVFVGIFIFVAGTFSTIFSIFHRYVTGEKHLVHPH